MRGKCFILFDQSLIVIYAVDTNSEMHVHYFVCKYKVIYTLLLLEVAEESLNWLKKRKIYNHASPFNLTMYCKLILYTICGRDHSPFVGMCDLGLFKHRKLLHGWGTNIECWSCENSDRGLGSRTWVKVIDCAHKYRR